MLPMKLLTSSCVGQDFWQGASAHLRQRPASLRAALSLSEVCFMSSKFLKRVEHELKKKVSPFQDYKTHYGQILAGQFRGDKSNDDMFLFILSLTRSY